MSDTNKTAHDIRRVGGVVLNNVVVNLQEHHPEIPPEQIPAVLMVSAINMIMHIYGVNQKMGEALAFSFVVSAITTLKINGIDLKIEIPELTTEQKDSVGIAVNPTEVTA